MAMINDKAGPRFGNFGPGMMARVQAPLPTASALVKNKRAAINQTMENTARAAARAIAGGDATKMQRVNRESRVYLKKATGEYNNLKANAQGGTRKPASRRAMAQVAYTQEENAFKARNKIK